MGKSYEMIDSLATKGFVFIIPSKPMKCQAISPKKAIDAAREVVEKRLLKLENHAIEHLEPRFQSSKKFNDPKGAFLLMKGRANIIRKVEELLACAKNKVNILTTENGLKRLVAHKELLRNAKDRGVDIRITAPLTDGNSDDAEILSFCDLKHAQQPHNTMYSFDQTHTIVVDTIPDNENYICGRDLGMISLSPSFSSLIDNFYDTYFQHSEQVQAEPIMALD